MPKSENAYITGSLTAHVWYKHCGHIPLSSFRDILEAPKDLSKISQQYDACECEKSVKASSPAQTNSEIRLTRRLAFCPLGFMWLNASNKHDKKNYT
jgi:hypothetical protein